MKFRWMIALGAVLLLTGLTRAQQAETVPAPASATSTSLLPTFNFNDFLGWPFGEPTASSVSYDRRLWVTGEYMFTLMRGTNLPPLVTSSPAGTPRATAGVLGEPGTQTLFGGYVDDNLRPGFRFGVGYWFDNEQNFGIEAGAMIIGSQTAHFDANSTNGEILARPYFDINTGTPQAVLVAYPGSSNGSIDIAARSGSLYEAHFDFTEKAVDCGWFRSYALIGFRYFRYDERLTANQSIAPTAAPFVPGTEITSTDNFYTRNEFYGGDLGFRWVFIKEQWSLEFLGKVAVGSLNRSLNVGGSQTINIPGAAPVVQNGGVLALSSNSGVINYQDWRAIPEFGMTLNWQVLPNVTARVGYSFMYFNAFARAADQIDTVVNTGNFPGAAHLPGPDRPALNLQRSDFWLQSINLGVEWTY